jgi:hypothetical protein
MATEQFVATAVCTEHGCIAQVRNEPDNLCGGDPSGGPQGCGEPFCDDHLYATYQYGYLCADDRNNIDDWLPEGAAE